MFFDRQDIQISVSKDIYIKYAKALKERDINFEDVINIFMAKSLEGEKLILEEVFLDYKNNKEEKTRDYLTEMLKEGQESFKEGHLSIHDILSYLGVSYV